LNLSLVGNWFQGFAFKCNLYRYTGGSGNIDTAITTAAGLPFVIEYSVVDSAGNAATVARRRVRVVNPCANAPRGPANLVESLCSDGTTCSVGGVCPVVVGLYKLNPVRPIARNRLVSTLGTL
jgi:hypothetical protein